MDHLSRWPAPTDGLRHPVKPGKKAFRLLYTDLNLPDSHIRYYLAINKGVDFAMFQQKMLDFGTTKMVDTGSCHMIGIQLDALYDPEEVVAYVLAQMGWE